VRSKVVAISDLVANSDIHSIGEYLAGYDQFMPRYSIFGSKQYPTL
jgi:hypothetical protein